MTRGHLYRTPAVILKRTDLGEADRIVTFFSRDVGKIRAVAKGVRRTTSRSAGHLEPFTLSDVLFAVGRELDVISQADTVEAFREVREDVELTTHAYYLAEVVDLLTEDRLENREVFDTLVEGLRSLRSTSEPKLVLIVFHLKLLEALGYRPELRPGRGHRSRHRHLGPEAAPLSPAHAWRTRRERASGGHPRGGRAAARLRRAHRRAAPAQPGANRQDAGGRPINCHPRV